MIFFVFVVLFFVLSFIYFRIANRYNIIDKPNERSLHQNITIRGGGILFPIAIVLYFIGYNQEFIYFTTGLIALATISFLDDVYTLPNRYRLPVQFFALGMMGVELGIWSEFHWFWAIGMLVLGVAIVNAYNFMDGINGITGGYSLVVLAALAWVNQYHQAFIDSIFILLLMAALLVFNFFNFRHKAKCFAGDVGSVSIALVLLFLIAKISLLELNPMYFLFLAVYGVDSGLTIIHRLWLKQNIFKAHRLHLFQVIVYETKMPHLWMSSAYALIQAIIALIIIRNLAQPLEWQLVSGIGILVSLSIVYILLKRKYMK